MTGIAGAIVNAAAVIVAGIIGRTVGQAIPKRIADTIMKGLGLVVIYIGISGALDGEQILVTIISIALGALIGEAIDINLRLENLAERVEKKLSHGDGGSVAEGMCAGTLLFCVGAMAVVGSLQAGLTGDCSTIFTKSLIDFIAAIVLASTMGIGVAFAAVPLFIYQGAITVFAGALSPYLSDFAVAEMSCTGSLLIFALGLNMIGAAKVKVANYLPAIFLPMAICPLYEWLSALL